MADVIPLKVIRTANDTSSLSEFNPGDTIPVDQGGTGGTTAAQARLNLAAASAIDLLAHTSSTNNPHMLTTGDINAVHQIIFNNHLSGANPHSVTATQTGAIPTTEKGSANGVPDLDAGGKIPISQLPARAIPSFYVVPDQPARLSLLVEEGDEAKQLDTGEIWIYDGATWHKDVVPEIVFGAGFDYSAIVPISTTYSTTFQNRDTFVVNVVAGQTYRVGLTYMWNHDRTNTDFKGRFLLNGVELMRHVQEPKDSAGSLGGTGTDQRHSFCSFQHYTPTVTGTSTFILQYSTNNGGHRSSIWASTIEHYRVI